MNTPDREDIEKAMFDRLTLEMEELQKKLKAAKTAGERVVCQWEIDDCSNKLLGLSLADKLRG